MPRELEVKIKVESHDPFRDKLRDAGAKRAGVHLETNSFFDFDDGSLRASDNGLRLRVSRSLEDDSEKAVVTHKGPRQPGAFKNREENETSIGDAETVRRIFGALGLKQVLSFEKKRESWELGVCKVELDEVPHLGFYLEVEGPSEEAIREVQKKLGVEGASVRESYAGLLSTWLAERGSRERAVRFPGAG